VIDKYIILTRDAILCMYEIHSLSKCVLAYSTVFLEDRRCISNILFRSIVPQSLWKRSNIHCLQLEAILTLIW